MAHVVAADGFFAWKHLFNRVILALTGGILGGVMAVRLSFCFGILLVVLIGGVTLYGCTQ